MSSPARTLREEGAILGRYLIGLDPPERAQVRYVEGCSRLFADPASREDTALLAFACRHTWSLPCLDAAVGLLRPTCLLRRKIILMLAILETSPDHADLFLPAPRTRAAVLARLALSGAGAAMKTLAGILILPAARWGR